MWEAVTLRTISNECQRKKDQGFREKLWDAKNRNYIWQLKKMKFSQQHTDVHAEKQIEKSLKGILYF